MAVDKVKCKGYGSMIWVAEGGDVIVVANQHVAGLWVDEEVAVVEVLVRKPLAVEVAESVGDIQAGGDRRRDRAEAHLCQ